MICFAALEILSKDNAGVAVAIGSAGFLCIIAPAVLSIAGMTEQIRILSEKYNFFGCELLIRAFGISICCEITENILEGAGRKELAKALSFSSKVAILLLCVPLWKKLFEIAGGLLA